MADLSASDGFSRRAAVGTLLAGALGGLPARSALACTPNPQYTNFKNVKVDFCARGDGVTDDTAAIQNAVNSGQSLYFPTGMYMLSDSITLPASLPGIVYFGSGKGMTIIQQNTTGKDAFFHNSGYLRTSWRDMTIQGASGTGHGIHAAHGMYACDLTEMSFYMGGSGVYATSDNSIVFSTLFNRCEFSSHDAHGIEIVGGNTCVFLQCYAMRMPSNKVGYRVYSQCLMLGCNGIDQGGGWGLFGATTADGDGTNALYQLTCINCNIEAYTTDGIRLKVNGTAYISNCRFTPTSTGTYNSHITIDYSTRMIQLVSCGFASGGATLAPGRLRPIYSPNGCPLKVVDCPDISDYQSGNIIYFPASETVGVNEAGAQATVLNSLRVGTLAVTGPVPPLPVGFANALVLGNSSVMTATTGTLTPPPQVAGYLDGYLGPQRIRVPYYLSP